jgi:hypothetical protein
MGEIFFVLASRVGDPAARPAWRVEGVELDRGTADARARSIQTSQVGDEAAEAAGAPVSQVRVYSRGELVERVGDERVRRIEDALAGNIAEKRKRAMPRREGG